VVEVGSAVESFRVGDAVFGDVMDHGGSAFAEYVCVPEMAPIVHKPPTVSFAEASTLPQAGVIAFQGMSGSVEPGDRVLVNGAGGGAGAFAVQIAKTPGRRSLVSTMVGNRSSCGLSAPTRCSTTPRRTSYPLDEVPEALRHLGEGRALGKLVIGIG
jgi:NADPH:quinone reductase-like Zn-dependent oxidoreductase